jgi:predicted deacylase
MIITRDEDWLTARIGDELVMMSMSSGDYVGLSETGAAIWELLETPRDVDSICTELQRSFDVSPERCRTTVDAFLLKLSERGAIAGYEPQAA